MGGDSSLRALESRTGGTRTECSAEGRWLACLPRGWCVLGPDVRGHRDPALPRCSCLWEEPGAQGLLDTLPLHAWPSQTLQQLLHVRIFQEFQGPGKRPGLTSQKQLVGWATGPSGSFRASGNTYVSSSEGTFGRWISSGAEDKGAAHTLRGGSGQPLPLPSSPCNEDHPLSSSGSQGTREKPLAQPWEETVLYPA